MLALHARINACASLRLLLHPSSAPFSPTGQRSDAVVMHELLEPFLRAKNAENYAKIAAGQETKGVQSSGCTYETQMEVMCAADYSRLGTPLFFTKELSCYADFDKLNDKWLGKFKHVLLVRHPKDSLQSFYRVALKGEQEGNSAGYFDAMEAGFVEQARLYQRIHAAGAPVIVLDADDDLVEDPEKTLRSFCEFAGVPFDPAMLSWAPQELPEWQKFRGWHDEVAASTGFIKTKVDSSIVYPTTVNDAIDVSLPFYQALLWQGGGASKLRPTLAPTRANPPAKKSGGVALLCVSSKGDLLPTFLAACLIDEYKAFHVLPSQLNEEELAGHGITDDPLVVVINANDESTISMAAGALDSMRSRGLLCLLRVVIFGVSSDRWKLLHLDAPIHIIDGATILHHEVAEVGGVTKLEEALTTLKKHINTDLAQARLDANSAFIERNQANPLATSYLPWRLELSRALAAHAISSAPATTDDTTKLSLTELYGRAAQLARQLTASNCAGKVVGLYVERSVMCCWAALGALIANAKFVDIAASSKRHDVGRVLGIAQPALVLTTSTLAPLVASLNQKNGQPYELLVLDQMPQIKSVKRGGAAASELERLLGKDKSPGSPTNSSKSSSPGGSEGSDDPEEDLEVEDDPHHNESSFCVLTSGTTSISKIVVCPEAGLTHAMPYFRRDLVPGDRVGLFWIYYYFLCPLLIGCTVHILSDANFLDPHALLATIKRVRLNALYVTPSLLESMMRNATTGDFQAAFQTVKVVWLTGESVKRETLDEFRSLAPHASLHNIYSTNETGDVALQEFRPGGKPKSQFEMLDGIQAVIKSPDGQTAPRGTTGQLWVNTSSLFTEYWHEHAVVKHERGFFPTGDLVRNLDPKEGRFAFVRREVGEHIKIRGFKVFPKLIEGTLTQHTAIADAWCVALGETDQTRRLEAAIAIAPKQKAPQLAELREWLSERVPQYMIPIAFYLLPENRPITATSGKADERAIAKLFETLPPLNSHSEISAAATNLTPAEVKLADAWREVLELKLTAAYLHRFLLCVRRFVTVCQARDALNKGVQLRGPSRLAPQITNTTRYGHTNH